MSNHSLSLEAAAPPTGRLLGVTEHSWCRALAGGTGTTAVAILASKAPDASLLQTALHKIQAAHAILRSKIRHPSTGASAAAALSFVTPAIPSLQIKLFDLSSTSRLLHRLSIPNNLSLPSFRLVLEHELNQPTWSDPGRSSCNAEYCDCELMFASVYELPESKWAVVLRFHTAACDRTTAASLLRELLGLMRGGGGTGRETGGEGEVSLGIEDLIPKGKGSKGLWARGVDMLGYSLNSLRLTNLKFKDMKSSRSSEMVRLRMCPHDTARVLAGCKSRGIKLCGALAAAGLIAADSYKRRRKDHQRKKHYYGVVTFTDCRPNLHPPLSPHHFGFYHSAILNQHAIKGGEQLWDLAGKSYDAFATSKKENKHFSDMADLNFLMCKAIENPSLTPSSSLRTSFVSVFEDPVVDEGDAYGELGVEDYVGCASVHGVGPSIALFDTVRGGGLDCACVYPAPLHSREQMQELVDVMKTLLVEAGKCAEISEIY
ncbi:uncharacterized protein LOC131160345 [Malania oleifera]|uniref:uncharacterized protein LOC131160345 n=1 Tax=Malania oleifera TaxID=397392 RepID=UPI0025AEB8B4|nr:uncharacterized protein LOC131160345 [Malania oleifera]